MAFDAIWFDGYGLRDGVVIKGLWLHAARGPRTSRPLPRRFTRWPRTSPEYSEASNAASAATKRSRSSHITRPFGTARNRNHARPPPKELLSKRIRGAIDRLYPRAICVAVGGDDNILSLTLRTDCAIEGRNIAKVKPDTIDCCGQYWMAWCRLPVVRQFLWCTGLSFSIGRQAVLGQIKMSIGPGGLRRNDLNAD